MFAFLSRLESSLQTHYPINPQVSPARLLGEKTEGHRKELGQSHSDPPVQSQAWNPGPPTLPSVGWCWRRCWGLARVLRVPHVPFNQNQLVIFSRKESENSWCYHAETPWAQEGFNYSSSDWAHFSPCLVRSGHQRLQPEPIIRSHLPLTGDSPAGRSIPRPMSISRRQTVGLFLRNETCAVCSTNIYWAPCCMHPCVLGALGKRMNSPIMC